MKSCVVCNCNDQTATFHKFPSNPSKRQQWLDTCKIERTIPHYSYVCSSHFTKDDYANSRLRVNALPKHIEMYNECSKLTPSYTIYKTEQCPSSSMTMDNTHTYSIISNVLFTNDSEIRTPQSNDRGNLTTSIPQRQNSLFNNSNSSSDTVIRTPSCSKKLIWRSSHIASLTTTHFLTPRSAEKNLNLIKQSYKAQNKKIKCLTECNRRLVRKVKKLKDIIETLEKQCKLSEQASHILKSCHSSLLGELITKTKKGKFSPELMKFAVIFVILQSYSVEAYGSVRNTFKNCLPHPKSISRWSKVIDGKPGFSNEDLLAFSQKAANENLL